MKKFSFIFLLVIFLFSISYAQSDKSFFIPEHENVKQELPFPGEISGHTFGEWHFSHDQLLRYLTHLTDKSDKLSMWEYGRTHENRPLTMLAVTSPENQENLEELRKQHLNKLNNSETDGNSESPLVLWLGYSVHGDESSPGNAAMLVAYYLAASKDAEIKDMLDSTIILIDPCLNPDGFTRAATWSNMHTHNTIASDPSDRQFRQDFPGGRTNHYWFDLNRDWLPVQQPESKARLETFHKWKPHVVTDHHEMGSDATFFFQPGVPERVNPHTPEVNFQLTKEIGTYHAKALDDIGSLYFSEEVFDDYYYGKGSTYPDVNASIGILFEQESVMGQEIETSRGKTTFAEAIKNHFTVSLSTIKASTEKKRKLVSYQQNFFEKAEKLAEKDRVSAYVFGDEKDPVTLHHFMEMLQKHSIDFYSLTNDLNINGTDFKKGEAYLVPAEQNQYRLIKSLFEKRTEFEDSIFYDVSSWTMPYAFDLDYDALYSETKLDKHKGGKVRQTSMPKGEVVGGKSEIGYIANGENYNIHSLLYKLKEENLDVRVAAKPFATQINSQEQHFNTGSIFIPSSDQSVKDEELYVYLDSLAHDLGVDLYSLETGLSEKGIDMGSWSFVPVDKPEILVVAGDAVRSSSAGEVWHLLDQKMEISVTMVKPERLKRMNLFDYNTIVMPNGSYDWNDKLIERFSHWLEEGGVMIALEHANKWLSQEDWISWEKKEKMETDTNNRDVRPYINRRDRRRAQSMNGIILRSSVDPTHPIGYGIVNSELPVFKGNNLFLKKSQKPYSTPLWIEEDPLISGYLSEKNKKSLENTAWCLVSRKGDGKIISFVDNPNFRGYWYGTEKVFLNAIFYGRLVR